MIFLYILKNLFIVIIGLLFSFAALEFSIYIRLTNMSFDEYYIHFFNEEYLNIIIFILSYIFVYFIFSLFNYLISSNTITNYYSFILALLISTFHVYILYINDITFDIESYLSLISIQIFLSFFINYSTKYENGINKNLKKRTF